MKVTISIKHLIIAIFSFTVAFLLIQGTIQKFLHFSDVLGEFACCIIALVMGTISIFASIEKFEK
jgi:hypothetical protein